jgi:hypothetical protein
MLLEHYTRWKNERCNQPLSKLKVSIMWIANLHITFWYQGAHVRSFHEICRTLISCCLNRFPSVVSLCFNYAINPFPHEHIVKNGRFHWKAYCYNCYETMKNASILIKLGTNVDWIIAFVTTCSVCNFLLPWQRGDISQLPKITILCWFFFPSKLISQLIEIESKVCQR